ncbi:MAG TPA: MarR family transcriptional regulator [Candidatus Angelobacter sp.]|jgi:predicted transcriptional regulator|nr:MarR family transcriptional regulator [Candidatus Angelobacter sp.]
MNKKVKVRVAGDGTKGFFDRVREHARKLDRGEELAPEITVLFQDANDMMRVLSAERIRLLRAAKMKATPVSDLAVNLKRDTRAVSRDVDLLERFGLLHTRYEKNPGHGRQRIVESRAAGYQLMATI